MTLIERRLGPWKSQPHQRIEKIVPVAGTELHLAAQEDARLIFVFEPLLPHLLPDKAQRPAAGSNDRRAAQCNDAIQIVTPGPVWTAEPVRRRAQRLEHRRALDKIRVP